jgi:hypothetical protein
MAARSKQGLWLAIGIVAALVVFVIWRFRPQGVVPIAGQDAALLAPEQPIQEVPGLDSFDHAAHHEALVELAPIHHARMTEAHLAQQALVDYETKLLGQEEFLAVLENLAAMRDSQEQVAAGSVAAAYVENEIQAAENLLGEMLAQDQGWVDRKAEADASDARRLAARQLIVERIQNRMRHDFAVKRAEREQADADGEP